MTSEFDELEEQIMEDIRRIYTETVIDHAQNPRNVGDMPEADGFAKITGPCGDTMEIWLKVRDDKVDKTTFWTDGCGPSIACGSMVTEIATNKRVAELQGISQEVVLEALGGLPEDHKHCALLAANTLKEAARDYLSYKREPWKRAYRKH